MSKKIAPIPGGGLRNELAGLRGLALFKHLKLAFAHLIGRAFWFDHLAAAIEYAIERHVERQRPLAYYEFGTGSGNTLERAISVLRRWPQVRIFLFDSFEGLPRSDDRRDRLVGWNAGEFAFSEDYIHEVIRRAGFPLERVRTVKGFFNRSLTAELAAELRDVPPAFVTVDVDYYSSTKSVLDFLAPILASGATFYFDDLWSFDGHPDFGQLRALAEFNDQWKERGQLVPNSIFQNRIYTYFNRAYEFIREP
jgi:hypothetical protein